MPDKRSPNEPEETVVVSFRAPRSLLTQLDELARGDDRTRANFIVRTLSQAVSLEPAIETFAQIQKPLVEEDANNPNSMQSEFWRGVMSGARWMLSAFHGKRAVRWASARSRERTKLPMPHVVPIQSDGSRVGFDSMADF